METIKLRRDPLLEIERTRTKGEDSHSYSEELVRRDEAVEDGELKLHEDAQGTSSEGVIIGDTKLEIDGGWERVRGGAGSWRWVSSHSSSV